MAHLVHAVAPMTRALFPTLIALLILVAPGASHAQSFELQGSVGLTDCTDEYCEDGTLVFEETSPGIGLLATGWARVHPFLGIGGGVHGTFIALDEQDGVDATLTFLNFDAGLRAHVPLDIPLDPFAGLTFGWSFASTGYESDLDHGDATLSGPTVAIHLGAEYAISDDVAVGGLFKYYIPFWNDYCYDSDQLGDDCEEPDDVFDDDDLPNVWYFGATISWRSGGWSRPGPVRNDPTP